MKSLKFFNKVIFFIYFGIFIFFSFNVSKIIFKEREKEKSAVTKSLNIAKEKIDIAFKYSIWNEIDKSSINYNEIMENYLFYKKELRLGNNFYICKIPYKEKNFSKTGKNAVLILKDGDGRTIENLLKNDIKTISEIESYLAKNGIKNYKFILKNSLNYTSFFSPLEAEMIIENYYKESFKFPIIRKNDMIFYKKEKGKIFMMKMQNYKYVLQNLLKTKSIKNYEYLFITSASTRYLYHPKDELLNLDILLEAKIDEDKELEKTAEKIYNENFTEDYSTLKNNKITSQSSVMGYMKLSEMPFYIGIISIKEELMAKSGEELKNIFIKSMLFFSITNFLYLIFNIKRISTIKIIFISFIQFIILTFFIFIQNFYSSRNEIRKFNSIKNEIETGRYLKANKLLKDFEIKIDINSIEFIGTNNVKIKGTAEYKNNPMNNFYFPDAVEYDERIIYMDRNKILKQFFITLRESFDFYKYPLDSNMIRLKIRNRGDDNKIIIPAFDKYENIMFISSKPGVNKNIVLNGWDVVGSFFAFSKIKENRHELLFNICLKREILNPFISTMLPISIILFVIFGILILIEKGKSDSRIEFILGSVSGLFFTIIISQNSLREQINTNELLYLDYYFFMIYIILIGIIILSFAYKYKKISYEKIYFFKRIFWFIIFFTVFTISYIIFKN